MDVEEWVREQRAAGYSDEALRESLIGHGYSFEQVGRLLGTPPAQVAPGTPNARKPSASSPSTPGGSNPSASSATANPSSPSASSATANPSPSASSPSTPHASKPPSSRTAKPSRKGLVVLVIVAAALLAAAGAFLLLAGGEERAPETTEESPAAPARAPDDASGPAVAPSDEPDGEPFDCGSIPGDALVEGEYPELDCFGEKLLACEPATLTVGEGSEEMLMEVHGRGDAACHVSMGMGSEMLRCPVPVENGGGQSSAELARSAIMALPLMALESSNGCTGNTEFMGAMDDLGTGDTNAGREDVMDSVSGDSCDPREEDCDCETSDDCIVDDELTAAFCRTGGCWVRYAPAAASIEGDGRAFCEAYVNGCQEASLTIAHEGVERTVTIDGPGSFEEEACTLTVSGAGAEVSSGSADRIADSVEACIHNLPVYFYWSLEENIHCCGYDMMYEP